MTTLVVIMAHADIQGTFDRHLKLWEAHGCDIIVYSPVDSVCQPRGHLGVLYGQKGHHSAEANRRFKRLISFLATTAYDRCVIFEYDALCLTPAIPIFFQWKRAKDLKSRDFTRPYLCGNVFHDDGPDKKFQGRTFVHPPLIFTHAGLDLLLPHLNALPDDAELGFWDRTLGLACERAGIEPLDFMAHGLGYAQNTIEQRQWKSAHDAAMNGSIFFHGVKDETVLRMLIEAHEHAKANGKLRHGLEIAL